MSLEEIVAFTVFAVVTSITPGPNNIMLAATGANVGMRRGIPHLAGISLGFALMLFLVATGLGVVILDSPALMSGLRMSVSRCCCGSPGKSRRQVGRRKRNASGRSVSSRRWHSNGSTRKPGSSARARSEDSCRKAPSAVPQAAFFALVFLLAGSPCMVVWLGFGAAMQYVLRTDRSLRIYNVVMGVLLAATTPLLL